MRPGHGRVRAAAAYAAAGKTPAPIRLELGVPLRLQARQVRADRVSTLGYEEFLDYRLVPDGATPVAIVDDETLNGGLCQTMLVFGGPGSGKTYMMMGLLEQYFALVVNGLRPGGLILDPKGVLYPELTQTLRRVGRADDLLVIGPSDVATPTNLLDIGEVISRRQLGHLLADIVVSEFAHVGDWDSFIYEMLEPAVEILGVIDGEITLAALVENITTVTHTVGSDGRPTLRPLFVEKAEAFLAAGGPRAEAARRSQDFREAIRRIDLLVETSESRQIRYVVQLVRIALGAAASPAWRSLSAGVAAGGTRGLLESPFSRGAIVLVTVGEGDPLVRRCVSTIAKALFQITAASRYDRNRRGRGWQERSVCLACDEFAQVLTEREADGLSDSDFFSRSRQYRCFNLLALQSVHMGLSRVRNSSLWNAVVGNANVRVFMSVNDAETAELAASIRADEEKMLERVLRDGGYGAYSTHFDAIADRPELRLVAVADHGTAAPRQSLHARHRTRRPLSGPVPRDGAAWPDRRPHHPLPSVLDLAQGPQQADGAAGRAAARQGLHPPPAHRGRDRVPQCDVDARRRARDYLQ